MESEKLKEAPNAPVGALESNKELSISKEFFHTLTENFDEFAVFTVDNDGKVTSWSKAAERLLGYKEEEILGKEMAQFYTPKEIRSGVPEQEIREAIQSGKGLEEQEHLRKDGTRFWANVLVFPLKDASGKISGFTKIVRDISAFKLAEQRLQDALHYAHSIVETVRGPLVVLDGSLRIKTANRSFYRFFRTVADDTIGRLIYDIGNRQWDIPQLRNLLETVIPRGASFDDFLVERTFENIGPKIMMLNAHKIPQESDHTELILLAFEDITERKTAENALEQEKEKLQKINEKLQDFNHMISHDIRAPLRRITSFADILVSGQKNNLDAEAAECLEEIRKAVVQANSLVTDLLALSKIDLTQNDYSEVNFSHLIASSIRTLGLDSQKQPVAIDTQQNIPDIRCDPVRMKQVFTNLIGNAVKFSSKRAEGIPQIKIGHAERDTYHEFSVKDNGIGIPEEHRQSIFEIFKRLHSQDEYEGTGIGLHIVKKIIQAHNGRIWVHSKMGKGSTFYFTLPKAGPAALN